ncbi:MAG: AAA family ATPase [Longimicrobiales bacterium]
MSDKPPVDDLALAELASRVGAERRESFYVATCPRCAGQDSLAITLRGAECRSQLCGWTCTLDRLEAEIEAAAERAAKTDDAPCFSTLAELLERPELLRAPECIVPRLAYRGRLVVVAGPDKSGKSTLAAYAIAALSNGEPFLGEPVSTRYGRSVLVGLEEAVGDEVRRLADIDAAPMCVQILTQAAGAEILTRTRELLTAWPADLVVVDSLSEYARSMQGAVPEDGDTAGWAAAIRPLVSLAREFDLAVLVLHHVRRSDGQYRGSGEIAAACDAILEMEVAKQGEDPTLRRFKGRGRWAVEPWSMRLGENRPELGEGIDLSLDARVLLHVEGIPGLSTRELCRRTGGRTANVMDALRRLKDRRAIENRGGGTGAKWHPIAHQVELGVGS